MKDIALEEARADFETFRSIKRDELNSISKYLSRLPDSIATKEVHAIFCEMAAMLGRIEETAPAGLSDDAGCGEICKARNASLDFERAGLNFYRLLFFKSIDVLKELSSHISTSVDTRGGTSPVKPNSEKTEPAMVKPSRTARASEAAQETAVAEWKRYAVVMSKVAYDCGYGDRTQVTRSEYKAMAKRHGDLSGQALELLRGALPDGVTKKTGGASSQG